MVCKNCQTEFSGELCPNCGAKAEGGMKAIKCEMCSSTDIVKQDGMYVCQFCGTKYTIEEAKKLINGTVKIDNSEYVQKYLANARRAKQKEDWDETEKYYNLVEQNEPDNIEAIFYSSYGKAKSSLVESDLYKRQAAFKVLTNCVSILDDNFNVEKEEENRGIIEQISNDIFLIASSNYVYNQRKNGYGVITWTDKLETVTLFNGLGLEFVETLKNIAEKIPDADKQKRVFYYNLALKHLEWILKNGSLANPSIVQNKIMSVHRLINAIDPSHQVPESAPSAGAKQSAGGGCYVATAVYGSYNCPQVWTLRRYRDDMLAQHWYGRAFIRSYYAVSPTLVKWFGNTNWFKRMWRGKLDRMVSRLRNQGVSDKPYEDKKW